VRSALSCSRLRRVRALVTVEMAARTSDSFLIAAYWGGKSIDISCSVSLVVSSSDEPGHNVSAHEVEGLTIGSVLRTVSFEHGAWSAPSMAAVSPGVLSTLSSDGVAPQDLSETGSIGA
jgi:hypothetical protein